MRGCVVAAALVGLLPRDAKAQSMPADSMTHMPAFTEGIPAGWSIPPPHLRSQRGAAAAEPRNRLPDP